MIQLYKTTSYLNVVNSPQIYDSGYIVFDKHLTSKSLVGRLVISSIINYIGVFKTSPVENSDRWDLSELFYILEVTVYC